MARRRFEHVQFIYAVDGDTVELRIDLGFYCHVEKIRFRLAGINAPEKFKPGGPEAMNWLSGKLANGKIAFVVVDKVDKYGRYLVTIFLEDEEKSVNAQMVEAGHAVPFMV